LPARGALQFARKLYPPDLIAFWLTNRHLDLEIAPLSSRDFVNHGIVGSPLSFRSDHHRRSRPERTSHTLAKLPPLPPAGRAPQGGHNAASGKANPKDARAGSKFSGNLKQGGVSKVAQSSRKQGDR
jgi:hypothetical protein